MTQMWKLSNKTYKTTVFNLLKNLLEKMDSLGG